MTTARAKVWAIEGVMPTARLVLLALAEGWRMAEDVAVACDIYERQAEIILGQMADRGLVEQQSDGGWELA